MPKLKARRLRASLILKSRPHARPGPNSSVCVARRCKSLQDWRAKAASEAGNGQQNSGGQPSERYRREAFWHEGQQTDGQPNVERDPSLAAFGSRVRAEMLCALGSNCPARFRR